jgi:acetyl-CoA synthetase
MSSGKTVSESQVVWRPTTEYIERAHLTHFMKLHDISSFQELVQRSGDDISWFTDALINYLGIQFRQPYSNVVDLSKGPAWPTWCVDGRMNIIETCLEQYVGTPTEITPALIWEGENGDSRTLSYLELSQEVGKVANALLSLGLKKGDPIGLFMPMTPEVAISLLAIAQVGGIILPLFSGYGSGAVSQRLQDAGAKALFTADGFTRRGKTVPLKPVADEAAKGVPTLEHVIVLENIGNEVTMKNGRDHWWHEIILDQPVEAPVEDTAAEDWLMIIYTSGTSGRPKGTLHTHCGFPIKSAQDMAFGTDVHAGDVIYWMTDMGWMMGPWLVFGALINGATMFFYDGAPDYPGPDRVWRMVAKHRITTLGLSPTLVRSLIPHGEDPIKNHDLSSLLFFASTGEPWNPDPWLWLFNIVGGGRLPIINYSGGTEISGGILMGNPLLPLKPGAFSGPCPGIAADVLDEKGAPIRNQVGELVIKAPWIGMTRGFWKDPDRYEATYWSRFENTWVHGDWAAIDEDGLWFIYGRSDDTIKVAGKRLGPAEVESVLVSHPVVVEAAAIGVPDTIKGSALVCFCVLDEASIDLSSSPKTLYAELIDLVISELGKPMAPKDIHFVPDIPKTRNAKVMRRLLRSAYLGEDLGDVSSLVNPEALDAIGGITSETFD